MGEHAAYAAGTYRPRRSVLYMPSSNERALEKAKTLPVDALILDLEDAVAVDAKDLARENACAAAASGDYGRREITIRVNGIGTQWHDTDLAAACAAGPDGIVVPKVNTAKEVKALVRAMEKHGAPDRTRLWAMIETPTAIFNVRKIARESDRLAALVIGTNDLVAYTLAVDRTNRAVSHLYRPFHPAVIGLIKKVVDGAGERGIKASCCGDLAGSPAGAVLLAGLGVEELSMAPAQVPWVKHALSRVSLKEARAWSREAAELYGNGEAEKFLLAQLKARSVMLP